MKEDKAKLFLKKSECSVKTCAHFLKEALKKRKIPIFAVYDHGENAKRVGMDMPETIVIVFGNPSIGTKLMLENAAIALELPLKIAIWEEDQHTYVATNRLLPLAKRYGICEVEILQQMEELVEELVWLTAMQKRSLC